ncbi:hypothetical protein C8R44DRAFT_790887 [Mycena epipterygia]|nr:hypothetical protein C8R44DRAFT_825544 [Mycena epipterygia]KAJ7117509.1 hypothetical protein C8R44DRAFT_790887 [Mycena epipterygia]
MDAHTPQPSVRLVRGYTKRPPPLEIPTLESIRARGTSSSTSSSTAPSPSSASTLVPLRAEKCSVWRKMNDVIRTYGFDSLGEFLSVLFHPRVRGEKDSRRKHHRQAVGTFLQGQSKITMAHIMPLIYNHHKSLALADFKFKIAAGLARCCDIFMAIHKCRNAEFAKLEHGSARPGRSG